MQPGSPPACTRLGPEPTPLPRPILRLGRRQGRAGRGAGRSAAPGPVKGAEWDGGPRLQRYQHSEAHASRGIGGWAPGPCLPRAPPPGVCVPGVGTRAPRGPAEALQLP